MTPFEFMTVALSLVLVLALALVLSSGLTVFRARRDVRIDWLPVVWAVYIFVSQIQYWWGIFGLSSLDDISGLMFGLMLLWPILLFLAGGLVLPSDPHRFRGDLREYFEKDGRWGVLAYAMYWLVVPFSTRVGFDVSFTSLQSISAIVLLVLALWAFSVRRTRAVVTILFGVALTVSTLVASQELRGVLGLQP